MPPNLFVLVIDDDEDAAQIIGAYFKQVGCDSATAGDGISASAKIQKRKPDLIILDFKMPAADGSTVYERLRRSTLTMDIPVIFLTAFPIEHLQKLVPPGPLVRYHKKPVVFATLLQQARELLAPASAPDPAKQSDDILDLDLPS